MKDTATFMPAIYFECPSCGYGQFEKCIIQQVEDMDIDEIAWFNVEEGREDEVLQKIKEVTPIWCTEPKVAKCDNCQFIFNLELDYV